MPICQSGCIALAVEGSRLCAVHRHEITTHEKLWLEWANATWVYVTPQEREAARTKHRDRVWYEPKSGLLD